MLLFHTSVIFELTNRAISGMLLFYTQQVIVVTPRRSSLHPVATSGSPCPGILLMVLGLGHHDKKLYVGGDHQSQFLS